MKKTLIAIALAAMMAPAWGAEVVSSNIVGYEKLNLSADTFAMSGVQFVKVGGTAGSLNDLFKGTIPYDTQILFMSESGAYDFYTYMEEALDEVADDFVPGWGDGDGFLVTEGIPAGTGFWVKAPSATEFTQSGEVVGDDSVTISLAANTFQMASNPFPEGFNPNKVTWSDNLPYGAQILVQDADGAYIFYEYMEEALDEVADDFVPGWGDGDGYLLTEDIAVNAQGFWMKSDINLLKRRWKHAKSQLRNLNTI